MEPANYSIHFLEQAQQRRTYAEDFAHILRNLRSHIMSGIHFYLPDDGVLLPRTGKLLQLESDADIYPPYSNTVLEYANTPDDTIEAGKVARTKSIAVVRRSGNDVRLTVIEQIGGEWIIWPYELLIANETASLRSDFFINLGETFAATLAHIDRNYTTFVCSIFGMGEDDFAEMVYWQLRDAMLAYFDLKTALSCRNVLELTHPPHAKLQRSRINRGKLALFEYKILTLTGNGPSGGQGTIGLGKETRSHLRRGHIRRLPPDLSRRIWVNACMVRGKLPGFVHKDYRVPKAAPAPP